MNNRQMELLLKQFDKFGYYIDRKTEDDIEENRKGRFVLKFTDKDGNSLNNVRVRVKQISHEFKFGCTLFHLNQFDDERRNELYKERFKELFNYAVVPLYWDTLEPEEGKYRFDENSVKIKRRPPVDVIMNFCKENNIRTKGHCLIYNSFQPDWISDDNREIRIQIDRRLKAIAQRYPDEMTDVDVINEMVSIYKNGYKGNACRNLQITDDPDHEKWCFDICKKHFPHSRLFWNEGIFACFGGYGEHYRGDKSIYYMLLRHWIEKGAPIEGIGMQFHGYADDDELFDIHKETMHPLRILDVFDRYSDFGLPIHISEVSVPSYSNEPHDEQLQAEMVRRLYKLWFGRKNCDAVVWWNLVDNTAHQDENRFMAGLLRENCDYKPAFKALDELINKEWKTGLEDTVNGEMRFSGFYGEYEIEAVYNDRKITRVIKLHRDNTGFDNRLCDFRSTNIVL